MESVYNKAINAAKGNLRVAIRKRQEFDRLIERLQTIIEANAHMLPDSERNVELNELAQMTAEPLGFTDAIRLVVNKKAGHWANATGFREALRAIGFPLDSYNNPLASIHTILKRLYAKGEVDCQVMGGEKYYRRKK